MGQVMVPLKGELPKVADVVIVGGGIVGVSTAFFWSRAGLKTVVVEKREALGSLTTASSTECFRAQFESPENIELMLGSIEIFSHFDEVVGIGDLDIGLRLEQIKSRPVCRSVYLYPGSYAYHRSLLWGAWALPQYRLQRPRNNGRA